MVRMICNRGIADPDYKVTRSEKTDKGWKIVWVCPIYEKWKSMIHRCYSGKDYSDVTVCEEWLTFSNFKKWMETQDWEGKELDKDLLMLGAKIYSPETCCFISRKLNNVLINLFRARESKYLMGVQEYPDRGNKRFKAQINLGKGTKFLGWFYSENSAHSMWQRRKLEYLSNLDLPEQDKSVLKILIDKLADDIYNNTSTKFNI